MTTHKDAQIVRRLRAYENETGPESVRGLRDDAASEIVFWRVIAIGWTATSLLGLVFGVDWICK